MKHSSEELRSLGALGPEGLARYARAKRKTLPGHPHRGPMASVRTDSYKGHQIKIVTTYDIRIDGRAVGGHIVVTNAGRVHHHGLPNYSFPSAVDLARSLIDAFPRDFPPLGEAPRTPVKVPGRPHHRTPGRRGGGATPKHAAEAGGKGQARSSKTRSSRKDR